MNVLWIRFLGLLLLLALAFGRAAAQTPLDEDSPWPRVRSTNGHTVTLHLPAVERWTSNSFTARAAVEVKPAGGKAEWLGVVWFEAHGRVDRTNRLVTLDRFEITKARFPEAPDRGSNAVAIVREVIPSGARSVSLDYLITALGFVQAAARQGPSGLKHTPPEILWVTNRTVLIVIDGEPVRRPIEGGDLERVINTPVLLVYDRLRSQFYLEGDGQWFSAGSLKGPWSLAQMPPANVAALAPIKATAAPPSSETPPPRIIVSTTPAELLMTSGMPDYRPISGTALLYAADSDNQLFFHTTQRQTYLLLSGRWFTSRSLYGPWTYVAPGELPPDFAKIPPGSPQAVVLASVPGTPQADLALLANSVPTTATVSRRDARIELEYDGDPQFKPIEGTTLSYAVNAQLPVIRASDRCYALDNGVWFEGASPTGPWEVATEVPEEIYAIPPSSPVYYATYARIYEATDDEVEVGYTAGYQGAYEEDGTAVYGTGWDYEPWVGTQYYGWGWTYTYGTVYVPWYQWWLWRPWWTPPGGLRAALIENVYDRWQGRNGVSHHEQPATGAARQAVAGFTGHPALYGRFQGAVRPGALLPPANTLALNPYQRPPSGVRPGEVPRGAELLTTVRRSPGGGRDLYASPDGSVYRRQNDGWYRRQPGGDWGFVAPVQGPGVQDRAASGGRLPQAGGVGQWAGPGRGGVPAQWQGRGGRVPDSGYRARAQDVAALERQYYARSLSQMRAQQWRGTRNVARPVRTGARRR